MNVLFVCTGNTCRSPMAEAYFNAKRRGNAVKWVAHSAGISAIEGENISEYALEAMKELYGIIIPPREARQVYAEALQEADYILTMTHIQRDYLCITYPEIESKVYLLTQIHENGIHETGEEIHDPWGFQIASYKKTAQQIAGHIETFMNYLNHQPGDY